MTFTVQIGSGRALFILPGGRFDQITSEPLRIAEASANSIHVKTKETGNVSTSRS